MKQLIIKQTFFELDSRRNICLFCWSKYSLLTSLESKEFQWIAQFWKVWIEQVPNLKRSWIDPSLFWTAQITWYRMRNNYLQNKHFFWIRQQKKYLPVLLIKSFIAYRTREQKIRMDYSIPKSIRGLNFRFLKGLGSLFCATQITWSLSKAKQVNVKQTFLNCTAEKTSLCLFNQKFHCLPH